MPRKAADAPARKRKAADGCDAVSDAAATDVSQAQHAGEGRGRVGAGLVSKPSPSLGGSMELSMDQYYWGDADLVFSEPCVGEKEPLSSLEAQFQGNYIVQEKIKLLGDKYCALRRTRGDGNCFYRSFMFSYMEHIFATQDKAETDRIIKKIEQCKNSIEPLGYLPFEELFSIFVDLLGNILQGSKHGDLLNPQMPNYAVMLFRFITSGEIQRRPEFFEPIVLGLENKTVAQFCRDSVEPMCVESDHPHIVALSDALGVPIRVEYLDGRYRNADNLSVQWYDFIPSANASEGAAARRC